VSSGRPETTTGSRAAWVWGAGMLGYIFAVMQRTTFGVAGLDAADRFSISPATLSAFVFLQTAVYIVAQLPAGLLVDRWGSRTVLVVGGAFLAGGQLLLAVAPSLSFVVLARVLVGAGDAVMFVAVLGLIPFWFSALRVPLVTQFTGILGQLGQILSAVPFLALLHALGWLPAFAAAAATSLLGVALTLAVVRNGPVGTWRPAPAVPVRAIAGQIREVWRRPGTRLGFFGHMSTQFPMMVFSVLWGVPYLVSAQGLSPSAAGGLVTLFVASAILIGPVIGVLTARHPLRRSWLVLGIVAADVVVWSAVLAPEAFRVAWLVQYPVWLFAVVGVVVTRRKARRLDAARGVVPRPIREVLRAGGRR
jgi:MFS family permease